AATGALRHLTGELRATRLARIEPEEFFMFSQERPEVRLRPDGSRDIHWPLSEFFASPPADGRDGLLLFCGPEPHQRWLTYTKAFLDVAERCGVRRIVSLGALLAGAPHTRPVRVTALSTDMSGFPKAIQDFRIQCDQAVARDRATREHVRKLEQEYDAEAGEEQPSLPGGELDSDKLMQELQDFLRKQRGTGA